MSIYDKKLYIKKTDGNIQTANLYTDKSDVGDNYLTFKYNGNTVYAVLSNNGDIDFNVSYNHNLYKIKSNVIVCKTDEYRMSKLYPSTYEDMTELPSDRDLIEFVKYRKDLSEMFFRCHNLITVPLLDTSNITNMSKMFNSCYKLTIVPLLDTSNVTNMSSMFSYCNKLTTVPLLDTSNVTNMSSMFSGCNKLTTVPLFNTSNVTNMSSMLKSCYKIKEIPLFNTQNVKDMSYMFYNCPKLTTVPQFNTQNVIDMSYMFSYCINITELPIFDIRNVEEIKNMIQTTKITKITFKNKPDNLEVTPEILGQPDVQITFI